MVDIRSHLHQRHTPGPKIFTSPRPEVTFYEGDVWQAIREATFGKPSAVWLLDGVNTRTSAGSLLISSCSRMAAPAGHKRLTKGDFILRLKFLQFNDNKYHEGKLSKMPDFDVFFLLDFANVQLDHIE